MKVTESSFDEFLAACIWPSSVTQAPPIMTQEQHEAARRALGFPLRPVR